MFRRRIPPTFLWPSCQWSWTPSSSTGELDGLLPPCHCSCISNCICVHSSSCSFDSSPPSLQDICWLEPPRPGSHGAPGCTPAQSCYAGLHTCILLLTTASHTSGRSVQLIFSAAESAGDAKEHGPALRLPGAVAAAAGAASQAVEWQNAMDHHDNESHWNWETDSICGA